MRIGVVVVEMRIVEEEDIVGEGRIVVEEDIVVVKDKTALALAVCSSSLAYYPALVQPVVETVLVEMHCF